MPCNIKTVVILARYLMILSVYLGIGLPCLDWVSLVNCGVVDSRW